MLVYFVGTLPSLEYRKNSTNEEKKCTHDENPKYAKHEANSLNVARRF